MIQPNWYALILIVPLLIFLSIAVYIALHKKSRSSLLFLGIAFSFALYTFAHMLELMSVDPENILWWIRIQYIGIAVFPVFWLLFILNKKIHFILTGLLFVFPAAALALVWSTPFHEYFFQTTEVVNTGNFFSVTFERGIGYWIHSGFVIACFIFSAFWTFLNRKISSRSDKTGFTILHIATLLPIIPLVLSFFNITTVITISIIPYVFSISSILIAIALYRFELFLVSPLARMRLIEALKDPFLVVDVHQFVVDANPGFENLYKETDLDKPLIGLNVFELYKALNLSDDLRRQSFDSAVDWKFKSKHFEFVSFPVLEDHRMKGIIHYFHDFTNRRNYEQQLRLSLLRLEKLNDLSRVLSMWMGKGDMTAVTIKTATELLNSAFGALFFLESSGLTQRARAGFDDNFPESPPLTALFEEAAFEVITLAESVSYSRPPYQLLAVPLNAEILHGQPGAIVFIKSEDTEFSSFDKSIAESVARQLAVTVENARLYREVERRAQIDGLTGMYTRRHFESLAKHEFSYAVRYKRPFCIIMTDIDHFKKVNDTHGHPAGDAVLRQLAERLRVNIRDADILGRYGGEEFIILLPSTGYKTAVTVAERVHKAIGTKTMSIGTGELEVTASFGMSEYNPAKDKGLDEIVKRADSALYEAKNSGRNRICFKKPE